MIDDVVTIVDDFYGLGRLIVLIIWHMLLLFLLMVIDVLTKISQI